MRVGSGGMADLRDLHLPSLPRLHVEGTDVVYARAVGSRLPCLESLTLRSCIVQLSELPPSLSRLRANRCYVGFSYEPSPAEQHSWVRAPACTSGRARRICPRIPTAATSLSADSP